VFLLILLGYLLDWGWTGFKGKALWDWLNLLGVLAIPAVVGLGAAWYTAQQGKVSDRENTDNQRETALQAYIDKMSELLLDKQLWKSQPEDEVRKIARVRTLTVLPRLDSERKKSVLQFLYESGLIEKGKRIIDLSGADLHDVMLMYANLSKTDLSGADLHKAGLSRANLSETNLHGANLLGPYPRGVDPLGPEVSRADLRGADLREANVTAAQLDTAKSLQGATMPDGSKHP